MEVKVSEGGQSDHRPILLSMSSGGRCPCRRLKFNPMFGWRRKIIDHLWLRIGSTCPPLLVHPTCLNLRQFVQD
jgi:hypothetical protein